MSPKNFTALFMTVLLGSALKNQPIKNNEKETDKTQEVH
jgi:hypothetical protein